MIPHCLSSPCLHRYIYIVIVSQTFPILMAFWDLQNSAQLFCGMSSWWFLGIILTGLTNTWRIGKTLLLCVSIRVFPEATGLLIRELNGDALPSMWVGIIQSSEIPNRKNKSKGKRFSLFDVRHSSFCFWHKNSTLGL